MTAYTGWITKFTRIGASIGGVAGFLYAAYIMATSASLAWTDILDAVESVAAVLAFAVILGIFCIALGGVVGLVLGTVLFPLKSFTASSGFMK
jgi:hypothetical protein